MEFFSGLDVSMERTAICVVEDKGQVHLQSEVVTDPASIAAALAPFLPRRGVRLTSTHDFRFGSIASVLRCPCYVRFAALCGLKSDVTPSLRRAKS
jgi:hypothetical protein